MYGQVHIILKDFILEIADEKTWLQIVAATGADEAYLLQPLILKDALTFRLIGAAAQALDLTEPQALLAFGRHLALYALRSGNASFLKAQGATLPSFMANINNLHHQLERDHPGARFPFIEVDHVPGTNVAEITYLSARSGCSPIVEGAITEIGRRLYGVDVQFQAIEVPRGLRKAKSSNKAAAWKVRWQPRPDGNVPTRLLPMKERMSFFAFHDMLIQLGKLGCLTSTPGLASPTCSDDQEPGLCVATREKLMQIDGQGEEEVKRLLMRGVRARNIAASWSDASLIKCRPFWESSNGTPEDYCCSEDVAMADAFVSHSWNAPEDWELIMGKDVVHADFKATTLALMAKDLALARNEMDKWGDVTFWVDKACIPQDLPELKNKCVKQIEYFISQCKHICVIFTWQYLNRLWCIFEWASFLVEKDPAMIHLQTEFFVKVETIPLYLDAVRSFSLQRAECSVESDRAILKEMIDCCYNSTSAFEELVRFTTIALMARSMAYCAGRSARLRRTFFQPWVAIASELGFAELARALQGCKPDQWRAEANESVDSRSSDSTCADVANEVLSSARSNQSFISEWFTREVAPILIRKRKQAVREKPIPRKSATAGLATLLSAKRGGTQRKVTMSL